MSLNSIVESSSSSLRAIQAAIQGRSDNVNNAQNEDYTRRVVTFTSPSPYQTDTVIRRADDGGLRTSYYQLNSQSSAADTVEGALKQLGDILGTSQSTPSLQERMSAFTDAWKGLETSSASSSSESLILQTGDALASQMRQSSAGIDQLEKTLNSQAADEIKQLNTNLTSLAELNRRLSGTPDAATADPSLYDKRDQLLKQISSQVAVNPLYQTDGSVQLYSTNGTLLAGRDAQQFQWNQGSAPYVQPDVPPWVSLAGSTTSLGNGFGGGKIGAYLDLLNSSTATNAAGNPQVGAIEKLRDQLNGLAGLLTKPSPGTAYAAGGLSDTYANAAADRTTDLAGGPAVAPNAAGTSDNSLFVVDNTALTAPAVWVPRADTIQFNPSLLNGSATLKRLSASAVLGVLTNSSTSLNAGGVNVSNRTFEGITASIALYHSDAQAGATEAVTRINTATSSVKNRLTAQVGVNMDDEVAQMTVLQNAYSASARVINTVQTMFDTLLNLKG